MGEKSGVTSPEHVRCSGGKTVCGCKARAQTTRDGTARYGWGKEEAVCEGWDHDRSIAASRAFGNGIQRILFGGRTGSVQIRHNAIHYAVCRPLHTFEFTCCELCVLFEKILGLHPLPLWGNELSVVSLFQRKKPELPSRGLPFVEKIGREEARGRGERTLLQKGPSPDIILFNAKFVLPQLVEDGAHGDRHHAGKERDPLFR